MRALAPILILAFNFGVIQGLIVWPDTYYVEGEKIDLIEQFDAPFKLWKDDLQMRFDTYNGEVKLYVKSDNVSEGVYMEHYSASIDAKPILVCSTDFDAITIAEPLPSLYGFELKGEEIHKGKKTQTWTYEEEGGDQKVQITMQISGKAPVRQEVKSLNTKTGELLKHYVINYYDYTRKMNKNVFDFDSSNCVSIYSNEASFSKHLEFHKPHQAFSRYKDYHNKNYESTELQTRKEIFEKNWRLVKKHNSMNLGYTLTLNQFADRTPEEMRRVNSIRPHTPTPGTHQYPHIGADLEEIIQQIPDEFSWIDHGAVTRVKSQGENCGSCWAFATTASIEGALSVKYKTNFDLSEQSIVDCAWGYKVYGCDGGYSERAMQYVHDHGIATEVEYGGYLGVDGECHIGNMTRLYKISGFVAVTPNSVNALKAAVYLHGPVAAYVEASAKMSLYSHGLFYEFPDPDRDPARVNHVVTVVGYGARDGELYWIVKNSYGASWGQDGYILISAKDNTANILYAPYYPIV